MNTEFNKLFRKKKKRVKEEGDGSLFSERRTKRERDQFWLLALGNERIKKQEGTRDDRKDKWPTRCVVMVENKGYI